MQLENTPEGEVLKAEVKEGLSPYLFEAGIDIDRLISDKRVVIQDVLLYNVIEKRRRELDDIAKGLFLFCSEATAVLAFITPPFLGYFHKT